MYGSYGNSHGAGVITHMTAGDCMYWVRRIVSLVIPDRVEVFYSAITVTQEVGPG